MLKTFITSLLKVFFGWPKCIIHLTLYFFINFSGDLLKYLMGKTKTSNNNNSFFLKETEECLPF